MLELEHLVGRCCYIHSFRFHSAYENSLSYTCTIVKLLGPCFKTGRLSTFNSILSTCGYNVWCFQHSAIQQARRSAGTWNDIETPMQMASWLRLSTFRLENGQSVPPQRFQVFNSPFEVLFNCPSRYLFAIDLSSIFSYGWRLPPYLRFTPKKRDSLNICMRDRGGRTGLSPSLVHFSKRLLHPSLNSKSSMYIFMGTHEFTSRAFSFSFATTQDISIDFLSCA